MGILLQYIILIIRVETLTWAELSEVAIGRYRNGFGRNLFPVWSDKMKLTNFFCVVKGIFSTNYISSCLLEFHF